MRDSLLYIALFLLLLAEMLPIIPGFVTLLSTVLLVIYLISKGIHVDKSYLNWMLLVFGFFSLSMLWALNWKVSAYKLVYSVLPIFVATTAVYGFLKRSPGNLKKLLWLYMIAFAFLLVYMLLNLGDIRALAAEGERIGGTINENAGIAEDDASHFNSNGIALHLCYSLFVGYILFFKGKKTVVVRVAALAVATLTVFLILMTGSRKAFLLLLLPFVVFPLLKRKKGNTILLLPIALAVVFGGYYAIMHVPFMYEMMGSRIEEMFDIMSGTTSGGEDISRLMLIEYGIEWFKEKPIFGYGINNFRVLSDGTWMFAGRNFYAHNNYLELLVGVGVVGFLIYYSCYVHFWRKLRKNVAGNSLNSWVVVMIIVSLFLDFTIVSYYDLVRNLILCICFYAAEYINKSEITNKRIINT